MKVVFGAAREAAGDLRAGARGEAGDDRVVLELVRPVIGIDGIVRGASVTAEVDGQAAVGVDHIAADGVTGTVGDRDPSAGVSR